MSCYLCRRKAGIQDLVEKTIVIATDINIIKKFNPYNKKEDQVS